MADDNTLEIMAYLKEFKADVSKRMDSMDAKIENNHLETKNVFVTKDAFEPVKSITYGLVGAVLLAFITAIAGLVIISGG